MQIVGDKILEKFKNIEFLRVVGCIAIVLLHIFNGGGLYESFASAWDFNYGKIHWITSNGAKAVDLFFILSGLFFMLKIAPPPKMQSLYSFVKKKVIRLWPVLIWTIFLYFLVSLTGAIEFQTFSNIITFFGLSGNGIGLERGNVGAFWYVSAMLWVLVLFFYLLKNFDKKVVNLIIALLVYFSYVFLLHARDGSIGNHIQTFYNIVNVGMLRAFGGIGIGYFIAEWYKNNRENIQNLTLSFSNKVAVSILEFGCVFFIIKNLMLNKLSFHNQIIFIIVFTMTIVLFLLNKGYVSELLNNDINVFLGKYTYSIYLTHSVVRGLFKGTFWKYHPEFVFMHPLLNIVITLLTVLILGIITYHFVEKPASKYLQEKYL